MNSKLEICSFPDGKSAMLALTFDDGTLDHLEIAAPELEKRGWRGTFYINPQSNDRAPVCSKICRCASVISHASASNCFSCASLCGLVWLIE